MDRQVQAGEFEATGGTTGTQEPGTQADGLAPQLETQLTTQAHLWVIVCL